jgi:hypothetical protein
MGAIGRACDVAKALRHGSWLVTRATCGGAIALLAGLVLLSD